MVRAIFVLLVVTIVVLHTCNAGRRRCPEKPKEKRCKDPNRHWTDCGSHCRPTCENPTSKGIVCPAVCVPGCECNKGLLPTKSGECVPEDQCC